jgi:mannose-6-phosphate isomerase-like protein (cupin superfamily)
MARILLEVGEEFDHTHDVDTHTELINGEATILIGNEKQQLRVNEQIRITAHTRHKIVNTGNSEALFRCDYC